MKLKSARRSVVAVRPAASVGEEPQVVIIDDGEPPRTLDRNDHAARVQAEGLINETYQHMESRRVKRQWGDVFSVPGVSGNPGVRWWAGDKTVVIEWRVAVDSGRPRVLLTKVPRSWVMAAELDAALVDGLEESGAALKVQLTKLVIEGAMASIRNTLGTERQG
jgi:hypothetical protein